ncbi:hypothetical protein [Sphingomonas sp. dw_22]|uniref:hypothetical protein n=1 Tax=Sphingomonas sp. dw_22 TaxID=2721175 RepID=UPI001BD1CECA|nr:hypothetical protein [Sphingomonas sp. dw_22]
MDDVRIGNGRRRPAQVKRVRKDGCTRKRRACFLDVLALTCNVRLAAREADLSVTTAYRLRRTDLEFAALWREALIAGYERLETELVQRALQSINAIEPGDGGEEAVAAADAAVEKMDVNTILKVLAVCRATLDGGGQRGRRDMPHRRIATEEETNAALLKKLAVLEKQVRERV